MSARLTIVLAAAVAAIAIGLPTNPALAQTTTCSASVDTDGDGFTDAQECAGITTLGTTVTVNGTPTIIGQKTFPQCNGTQARQDCVDPASKDLFVVYVPAGTGSLLASGTATGIANPFANQTVYGVAFNGYAGLNVTVHVLDGTQAPVDTRQVTGVSTQKAVVIVENLDASDLNTLAYCVWGRPNVAGQGICTIYSQRIWNSIGLACGSLPIVTGSNTPSSANEAFKAYAIATILHEVGHSVGGLAPNYDSRYGGYHYAPGTIMEQYVVASTSKGNCKFSIPNAFNSRYDPPAVLLTP